MKTINVVAALVINQDQVFATQRGYGEFKDGWEFPGGKDRAWGNTGRGPQTRNPGRTSHRNSGRTTTHYCGICILW